MAGEQIQRSRGEGGRRYEKERDGQREADQDPVAGGRRCARSLLDQSGGRLAEELQALKGHGHGGRARTMGNEAGLGQEKPSCSRGLASGAMATAPRLRAR